MTVVYACNDDMAMGVIEAMREVDGADASLDSMRKFLVTGCDNVSTNVPYILPDRVVLEKAGWYWRKPHVPVAPTLFASIAWRDGLLKTIHNIAQLRRPPGETSAEGRTGLAGMSPLGVDEFMRKCFERPENCPIAMNRAINTPVSQHVLPAPYGESLLQL